MNGCEFVDDGIEGGLSLGQVFTHAVVPVRVETPHSMQDTSHGFNPHQAEHRAPACMGGE